MTLSAIQLFQYCLPQCNFRKEKKPCMKAKQLIIPQQINPFNAILEVMSIKKASSFRSAWHCSKYQVLFSLLIPVTSFFLAFTLLHREWITFLL